MGFSFYPKHEHKCPHVSHCPHLGGAALSTLVLLANGEEQSRRALHSRIDAERARNERLVAEKDVALIVFAKKVNSLTHGRFVFPETLIWEISG